jgi:creatinine amidohydrolase
LALVCHYFEKNEKGESSEMGYSIFDDTMVDMTWPEIEKSAKQGAIVLLPIGIIEEHGPHMGLAVDTYVPYLVCKLARRELETRGINALIAPSCYWGVSAGTSVFPGTFSVRKETMKALIYDILCSLNGWGFDRVFTVNWHADYHHCSAILEAVREARLDTGIGAYCITPDYDVRRLRLTGEEDYILVQKIAAPSLISSTKYVDLHAGSLETGMMLNYFPDHVNAELAKKLKATELTTDDLKTMGKDDSDIREVIPLGYFGDPASFDIETAGRFTEGIARDLAGIIERFIKGNR